MAMTGMTMTGMTSSTLTEANSQMDINHAADENRLQRFSLQRPIIKEKSRLAQGRDRKKESSHEVFLFIIIYAAEAGAGSRSPEHFIIFT